MASAKRAKSSEQNLGESAMNFWIPKLGRLMPPLTRATHKGQAGKILVVGGSLAYTGAPYYAAYSALRAGAELATIIMNQTRQFRLRATVLI